MDYVMHVCAWRFGDCPICSQQQEGNNVMPWKVVSHSGACPDSKPYAVVRADTGALVTCHETQERAEAHVRALYANTEESEHG